MDIYEEIRRNMLTGRTQEVVELVKKAVALCYPPESVLKDGLILGIDMLAYKFRSCDVSVPEALMVTRALKAGLKTITPYLSASAKEKVCTAVIGTVEGDLHDIGKNIVNVYISTLNIEVVDLGVDVPKEEFVRAVREHHASLLMLSALLPTTLESMRETLEELERSGIRREVVVFVGGFPVTAEFAREIGADYYTRDAIELREFLNRNLHKILKGLSDNKK